MAVLVSIYALSATAYRTLEGGMTINRMTILGWNTINIGVLLGLIYKQWKVGQDQWAESLQHVYGLGSNAYLVWVLFLLLATPWLFRWI
jgi:hypothetical protein